MHPNSLTAADIEAMDYNQLIGVVQETNRPPGGLRFIATVAREAFLGPDKMVLEIGTSTGFTAIELARLTGARIHGIDINRVSLDEARRRAEQAGVAHRCRFSLADATSLPDASESFDVVFCGNVTSLVSNRQQALTEYVRVLKVGGYLAAIPMYYVRPPADDLLRRVSEAIQVPIEPLCWDDWRRFFSAASLSTSLSDHYVFDRVAEADVSRFVSDLLRRPHLAALGRDAKTALDRKYREQMLLFRENLSHMGFTVLLLRKEPAGFDRELFTASQAGC